MSVLHKFTQDAKQASTDPAQPPNSISAKALDGNFMACSPMLPSGTNQPYKVLQEKEGWRLEPTIDFLICENGRPRRYRFFAMRVS